MGLRVMLDGYHGEPVETPHEDPEDAAEYITERAWSDDPINDAVVYVEDEDGEVEAFEVEAETVLVFSASESDRAVPEDVRRTFKATRKGGA